MPALPWVSPLLGTIMVWMLFSTVSFLKPTSAQPELESVLDSNGSAVRAGRNHWYYVLPVSWSSQCGVLPTTTTYHSGFILVTNGNGASVSFSTPDNESELHESSPTRIRFSSVQGISAKYWHVLPNQSFVMATRNGDESEQLFTIHKDPVLHNGTNVYKISCNSTDVNGNNVVGVTTLINTNQYPNWYLAVGASHEFKVKFQRV